MKAVSRVSIVLGVGVLFGCAGSPPVEERMFDHFARAGEIQTALIVGDLNGARRPARWLAESSDFPAGRGSADDPWVSELHRSARAVAEAPTIDAAADGMARLASTCAGCHGEMGGPRFGSGPEAEEGATVGSHMVRHLWAMDRMWEGLVGASSASWERGARVLAGDEAELRVPGGEETAALARALHREATSALGAGPEDRPGAYATLVKTCAACHTRVGVSGG